MRTATRSHSLSRFFHSMCLLFLYQSCSLYVLGGDGSTDYGEPVRAWGYARARYGTGVVCTSAATSQIRARVNRNAVAHMKSEDEIYHERGAKEKGREMKTGESERGGTVGMRVAMAVVRMWDVERGCGMVGRTAYKFANSIYLSRGVA